jgi:8-oxo-dGTP pyrophosphatase MutT (NUDIX family)
MEEHLIADIPVKALIQREGKVLIVLDRKWELPGGRMNVGEQPEETLHREVREELNVGIRILGLQDAFTFASDRTGQPHFIVVYRCELIDETSFHLDGKEIQDTRWVSADDDLSEIPFFPGYLEVLQKFFKKK